MRIRNIAIALLAVFGLLGAIAFFGFPEEKQPVQMSQEALAAVVASNEPEPDQAAKLFTRLDDGNLVLIKQNSADASLEEVINLFEEKAPIIIATCYAVDDCLKARQIMEPLAHDDVVQEAFYTVIIEAFDANRPNRFGNTGIHYMFAMRDCIIASAASQYTSTGLLEAALTWYRANLKTCDPQ